MSKDVEGRTGRVVNCQCVNLRSQPSPLAMVVEIIPKGSTVQITGEVPGYYTVKHGVSSGYIKREYLRVVSSPIIVP